MFFDSQNLFGFFRIAERKLFLMSCTFKVFFDWIGINFLIKDLVVAPEVILNDNKSFALRGIADSLGLFYVDYPLEQTKNAFAYLIQPLI